MYTEYALCRFRAFIDAAKAVKGLDGLWSKTETDFQTAINKLEQAKIDGPAQKFLYVYNIRFYY